MEKPMHGYEVKQYLGERMGVFWMINYGSIYPTLKELEKQGCVACKMEPSIPTRKVYSITEEGKKRFIELLKKRLEKEPHVRDEFTLHLFFLDYLSERESRSFLEAKKQGNKRILKTLVEKGKKLKQELPRYRYSALNRGIMHIKTELDWLEKVLEGGKI